MATEQRLIYINEVEEMVGAFADQAYTKAAYAAFWKVIHNIRQMPTIEARPVVHGRLGTSYMDEYYGEWADCLECGTDNVLPCNYCRNCGADMRGTKDGKE